MTQQEITDEFVALYAQRPSWWEWPSKDDYAHISLRFQAKAEEFCAALRKLDSALVFQALFSLACHRYDPFIRGTDFAAQMLMEVNPTCPLSCEQAVDTVAQSDLCPSTRGVPYYVCRQFELSSVRQAVNEIATELIEREKSNLETLIHWTDIYDKGGRDWGFVWRWQSEDYREPGTSLSTVHQKIAETNSQMAADTMDAAAWVDRSEALAFIGDFEGSLQSADRAVEVDKNLHTAWRVRAEALARMRRVEEALASNKTANRLFLEYRLVECDKRLAIHPKDIGAWAMRARILANLAGEAKRQAVELKPALGRPGDWRELILYTE